MIDSSSKKEVSSVSSVIQSSVLIGHILLMRDLYSLDVDHNELKELLSDLNNIIIKNMEHPIWENFREEFSEISYDTNEFPSVLTALIHSSASYLKENYGEESVKESVKKADKRVLEISERIGEVSLFDCRIPNPSYDPIYANQKRHFFLLKEYWYLYRDILEACGTLPLGYRPHPLRMFIVGLKFRIEEYATAPQN